jgi:serine/threonine protein kinase
MQRINPTKLTPSTARDLAAFLDTHEAKRSGECLIEKSDIQRNFSLTHRLLRIKKYNPRLAEDDFRYYVLEQAEEIGHGSFGSVQKICGVIELDRENQTATYKQHQANKKRIVKKFGIDAKDTTSFAAYADRLREEERALKQSGYHHSKPIAFHTSNRLAPYPDSAYLVSAQFESCDLDALLSDVSTGKKQLTIAQRLKISRNLIRALIEQVHERGLSHNDVKPHNIMVNANTLEVKFIDFGLACKTSNQPFYNGGTPDYIAPELILRKTYQIDNHFRSSMSDVYSLGLTLARLWGSTAHIYQGDLKDVYNVLETTKKRLKAVVATADERPAFTDLFDSITGITDSQKEKIRDIIRSLCHHRYEERLTLDQADTLFSDIYIADQYDNHLSESIKLASTCGKTDRAALKLNHNLSNCVAVITESVRHITDNPACIREYVTALGVKALQDCRSRKDVIDSTNQLLASFKREGTALLGLLEMTEVSHAIACITPKLRDLFGDQVEKATQELRYAFYKDRRTDEKDITLDSIAALTQSFRRSATAIKAIYQTVIASDPSKSKRTKQMQSYQNIMLSLLQPTQANRADEATLHLAARLRASIKLYLDATLTATNIKQYDRAGSLNRQQDMKDILDIISTARSAGEMEDAIEKRLTQFKRVGLFGSTLKKNIQRAVADFQAEQLHVATRGSR